MKRLIRFGRSVFWYWIVIAIGYAALPLARDGWWCLGTVGLALFLWLLISRVPETLRF